MTTPKQFRDLPEPVETLEAILRRALETLVDDLSDVPWFIREREVINVFVSAISCLISKTRDWTSAKLGLKSPSGSFLRAIKADHAFMLT